MRQCAEDITQLPRPKVTVKGFTLEVSVHSISPEPFGRFSLDITQMFPQVRQCAKPLTRLRRLKVKVTHQGHFIHLSIGIRSISPEPFGRFSLNYTQMFLLVRRCTENITNCPDSMSRSQVHPSRSCDM